ncbi:MAG: hypothetical protein AAFU54_21785 [Chloroflexota bacterium]
MQRLTIERVLQISLFALVFALATRIPVDTDTWWHIRSGEYTLTDGFIYEDPFSHTRNEIVWINHSWGTQLLLHWTYALAGDTGLALFTALLATGGMFFVYLACEGNAYVRAFAVVLGASTAAVFWSPRPQMVSFFLSAVVLYLLFEWRFRGHDRLWFLPPLFVLWGNMHAGFSIGFIFLLGMVGGEVAAALFNSGGEGVKGWRGVRRLLIVSAVSIAVIAINPYGYRMLLVPFQTVGIDVLRNFIQEWQSPNFQETQLLPFILLVALVIGAAGASPRRLHWSGYALLSGTLYMALAYGRNVAVFAVVATPILTFHVDALLRERGWIIRPRKRVPQSFAIVNAVFLALILAGCVAKILFTLNPERVREAQEDFLPVQVTAYLQDADLQGQLFNAYDWGGYLMWALPEHLVYVDGRTDLYGNDFLTEYINVYTTNIAWQPVFDEHDIGTAVLQVGSPIDKALAVEPGWTEDYRDEQAVVYTRDDA